MQKVPVTKVGLKKLEEERHYLKSVQRPKIIEAIASARALGDLSENAEYHAAREQQAFVEDRILFLDNIISRSQAIDPSTLNEDKIVFGATVTLSDLDTDKLSTYQIVGEHEPDIEKGLISYMSPLGKALIGKHVSDIVDINIHDNSKSWEIMKIEYK